MTVSTLKSNPNFPIKKTIKVENWSQTNQMPTIAIENNHLDSIHGPYIVSPLDIAIANPDFPSTKKIDHPKRDHPPQTDSKHVEKLFVEYKSQDVQTDFTSFTKPTHHHYSDSHFEKFLILDHSQDLKWPEAKKKSEEFNEDFFARYSNLFSIKFIMAYFSSRSTQSKL